MYELAILILLMQNPAHGYYIMKVMNDIIGPLSKWSNGRMYPLLKNMESEEVIESSEQVETQQNEKRPVHVYCITEKGKQRFHDLMMDMISNPGDYQKIFRYKIAGLEFLQISERLLLIDHYINFCSTHILYLTSKGQDMEQRVLNGKLPMKPERLHSSLNVIYHVVEQWQQELDWAKRLREDEIS